MMKNSTGQDASARESLLARLWSRLTNRPDSEHEQAIIRVLLPTTFLLYLLVDRPDPGSDQEMWQIALLFVLGFIGFALVLLGAILLWPGTSVVRRVIAMMVDIGALSFGLSATGELGAPWYAVYLWVTFGNGFRFGEHYLYLSGAMSVAGFAVVIVSNEFWRANVPLALGLLGALIVLPLYVAVLLRRLHEARRRAEEASRAKSAFLARMSHEIRTPLNGIIGFCELLQSSRLGRQEREYAQSINASARILLGLINDVLDLTKIEAGRTEIEKTDFDLYQLVGSSIRMLYPQARDKNLHLKVRVAPEVPFLVWGDPLHLRQILLNLIGNAIKFTEKGEVEVSLTHRGANEGRALVRFEVADTGIGIAEGAQPKIFDSFTQADVSTTRRYGGTGLGTTIAKHLVELMGGHIGFTSETGKGTTFWFDLPLEEQLPDDARQHGNLSDLRVLLLTSSATESGVVAGWLREWGVPHTPVHSMEEALARLTGRGGDAYSALVIEALHGPALRALIGLDGLHPEAGRFPEIPVIVVDGERSPDSMAGREGVWIEAPDKRLLVNALHGVRTLRKDQWQAPGEPEAPSERAPRAERAIFNVVVAEDNPTNQAVFRRILENAGHTVRLVGDGETLLRCLEEECFDVIIADFHMPGVGGIEAFQRLKNGPPAEAATPFILLTADATAETEQRCRQAGIEHFLTKPVSSSALLGVVDEAVGAARPVAGRQGAEQGAPADPQIDPSVFEDLRALGGGPEFLNGLSQRFFQDARALLQQMGEAVRGMHRSRFRDLAHALKGSAAHLGLTRLAALSAQANRLSDSEFPQAAEGCLRALSSGLTDAETAFTAEIRRVRS